MDKWEAWSQYINYLRQWTTDHRRGAFYGMSPACFDEWCDYEGKYGKFNEGGGE